MLSVKGKNKDKLRVCLAVMLFLDRFLLHPRSLEPLMCWIYSTVPKMAFIFGLAGSAGASEGYVGVFRPQVTAPRLRWVPECCPSDGYSWPWEQIHKLDEKKKKASTLLVSLLTCSDPHLQRSSVWSLGLFEPAVVCLQSAVEVFRLKEGDLKMAAMLWTCLRSYFHWFHGFTLRIPVQTPPLQRVRVMDADASHSHNYPDFLIQHWFCFHEALNFQQLTAGSSFWVTVGFSDFSKPVILDKNGRGVSVTWWKLRV